MLDQTTLGQDPLTQSTLPTIDMSAIMPLLVMSTIVGVVLTIVLCAYLVYVMIRRRKVENAMLAMQKDIVAIRQLLEAQHAPRETSETPQNPPGEAA